MPATGGRDGEMRSAAPTYHLSTCVSVHQSGRQVEAQTVGKVISEFNTKRVSDAIMGGSKPPTSKAQKSRAKMAKKLPGNIAKRFKLNNKKARAEEERWHGLESNATQKSPMITKAGDDIVKKEKGETSRQRKARLRELILGD